MFYTMHELEDFGTTRHYESEDGRLLVVLQTMEHDEGNRHDVANVWLRKGRVDRFMPTTLFVETYYTDDDGNQWGRFNPFIAGWQINFSRLCEATPENERALVAECAAMYRDGVRSYEAEGYTPCEVTPECLAF